MKDINGNIIQPNSLISIKSCDNQVKYYYVSAYSSCECTDYKTFNGYRVNKDFTINTHDKKRGVDRLFSYTSEDEITLIKPTPLEFLESLRTLHFWVENVIDELGVIIKKGSMKELLRPVKFQNNSYGIIKNKIYLGDSVDAAYHNAWEDLTYTELLKRWERLKNTNNCEWRKSFNI